MNSLQKKILRTGAIALAFGSIGFSSTALAQAIQLGDAIEFDLSEPEIEREYRINTEGDELDVEVYEREEPRTEIQLFDDGGSPGIDVRRTQPEPEKRLDFSLPID
ncbi:MAG: hypothetical protein AAFX40_08445 [Cyanobacteria bacterium J06639_1]